MTITEKLCLISFLGYLIKMMRLGKSLFKQFNKSEDKFKYKDKKTFDKTNNLPLIQLGLGKEGSQISL